MLWRSGGTALKIYDIVKNRVDETIPFFWKYQGEITKPIAAISSSDAYRILGIGLTASTKTSVLHYYERNDQKIEILSEIERRVLEPLAASINCAEVSGNGQFAYLGGTANNEKSVRMATLYACEFNKGFRVRAKETLDDETSKTPIVMKRIPSYEILAIGLFQKMILVEFDENTNKFIKLAKIPNLHQDYILDIAIKGEKIFSKGMKEKFVKVTQFGSKLDQSILMNPAFTSALNSTLQASPLAETSKLPDNLPAESVRYKQSTTQRIPVFSECVFEKIALSKTARAIYIGGGNGMDMLRYNDQSQQYVYTPVDVADFLL